MKLRHAVLPGILIPIMVLGTACEQFMPMPAPSPTSASPPVTVVVATPTPTTPGSEPQPKRIQFPPNSTTAMEQGNIAASGIARYVLGVMAGQALSVNVSSPQGNVVLVIFGADGTVLLSDHVGATSWDGLVPSSQDYYIDLKSEGEAATDYILQVTLIPNPTAGPVPTIGPGPTTAPQPGVKRITFPPGGTTAVVHGTTISGMDRWVLKALAGQTMSVQVSSPQGNVILVIWGADGTVLISDHAGATTWSGLLPSTQDYHIDLKSEGGATANYTLQVTIPPIVGPTPTTKRITFPPGGTTAVEHGTTIGGMDRWVLKALAGQTMSVQVSSPQGNVILVIWGADGTVLISDHAGATSWSGLLPSTQDYYIDLKSEGGTTANYTLQVTIPPLGS